MSLVLIILLASISTRAHSGSLGAKKGKAANNNGPVVNTGGGMMSAIDKEEETKINDDHGEGHGIKMSGKNYGSINRASGKMTGNTTGNASNGNCVQS